MDKVMNTLGLKNEILSYLRISEQPSRKKMNTVELAGNLYKKRIKYLMKELHKLMGKLVLGYGDYNTYRLRWWIKLAQEEYLGRTVEKMCEEAYWDSTLGESLFSKLGDFDEEDKKWTVEFQRLWDIMWDIKCLRKRN